MNLEDILDMLQADESVSSSTTSAGNAFGMDSFPEVPKKKKKNILRTVYPEMVVFFEQKRAMIDLDGTIHKYSKGYADGTIYDDPFDGAKDAINWLKKQGYEIVIFTTRASQDNASEMGGDHKKEIANIEAWLKHHNIYFDKVTSDKLGADFYIDDKAIPIHHGNWDAVLNVIKKKIKYNS
jgi:hypothetical protein